MTGAALAGDLGAIERDQFARLEARATVSRMSSYRPVPLLFERLPEDEMIARARAYAAAMATRRSVRSFSPEPVPAEILDDAIRAAASAPSGAHQQPWTFVIVSDPERKRRIREAAEEEERASYLGRMPPDWLEALAPLGTDAVKRHLTDAPHVIVVFAQPWRPGIAIDGSPRKVKHYYVDESVGIAVGMLLSCLHLAGLATLTHTPSPMAFLREVCERPPHERPFVVIPVGYPSADAVVPDLTRRSLHEVCVRL